MNELLQSLTSLCESNQCAINLQASTTGIIATVTSSKNEVFKQTSVYLDRNDKRAYEKLNEAILRLQ